MKKFKANRFGQRFEIVVLEKIGRVKAKALDPLSGYVTGEAKCNFGEDEFSKDLGIKIACARATIKMLRAHNAFLEKQASKNWAMIFNIHDSVNASIAKNTVKC